MADELTFDRSFRARPGEVASLSPLVRRITADNPGPFTFTGTNSYIVGHGEVAIIDPGPEDPVHLTALLEAVKGEKVRTILVTHTHRDHTGGLRALVEATGAEVAGCGPHLAARPLATGEANTLDESADRGYRPDVQMADEDPVTGPGWTLRAVATPGHTANHLAFSLAEEGSLFSGDHVMGWSTSIVAPPDGAMSDYMASLRRLMERGENVFYPGHGGPIGAPDHYVRALIGHRQSREAQILNRLRSGDRTIPEIVSAAYPGLDPRLVGAAGLSVFAHLEDLVRRTLVRSDGPPVLGGRFEPV